MHWITPTLLRMIADVAESGNVGIEPLLSRQEAARFLGVKPHTLAVWATTERHPLPVVKIGRLSKYRRADLEAFAAARIRNASTESTLATAPGARGESRPSCRK